MDIWRWFRLLRREARQVDEALPRPLEAALRAARPIPSAIPEDRAHQILASALAEAKLPRRILTRAFTVAGTLALAGCAILAGLVFNRPAFPPDTSSAEVTPTRRPSKQQFAVASIPGAVPRADARKNRSNPRSYRLAAKSRRYWRGYTRVRLRSKPLLRYSMPNRLHALSAPAPTKMIPLPFAHRASVGKAGTRLRVEGSRPTAPSLAAVSPTGHLVVIVSGVVRHQVNVEVTTCEEARPGFAKVSTYAAIGPGGGILTQCTVRDDAGDDGTSTAQYGVVYGQPISRLAVATDQFLDHRFQETNRFQIERGTRP